MPGISLIADRCASSEVLTPGSDQHGHGRTWEKRRFSVMLTPMQAVVRRIMTRAELMDTAIKKLDEVAALLMAAGEDRLAADAQELAEWVDFSSVPPYGTLAYIRANG